MLKPYQVPHECEKAEIAEKLAVLTPRQRRALRSYVWQVELGEQSLTAWLASPLCPLARSTWYELRDRWEFQAALEAYKRAGLEWQMSQERRSVESAQRKLRLATSGAAERLVEQTQADIGQLFEVVDRWTMTPLPSQKILGEERREYVDEHGKTQIGTFFHVQQAVVNLERLTDPRYSKLVKKFSDSPRAGISIELYDAQAAVVKVLEAQGVLRQSALGLNVDLGGLTDEQLERIAAGEDPLQVLAQRMGNG
jgi:hypothetical protein